MRRIALASLIIVLWACGDAASPPAVETTSTTAGVGRPARPSILLVTLDTTRADHMGYTGADVATPVIADLASRGLRFEQAYTTAPMTLPSHVSMMTGRYPAEHGVHENARYVSNDLPLLAEQLVDDGYTTAAFVSGYPLARTFGLARGFDHYDDAFVDQASERTATATTDQALAYLNGPATAEQPLFVWVHYFDAHDPYTPPEPFRSQYADRPYDGELAYVDQQLGRLVTAFQARTAATSHAIIVVGDHGEGLGEHGEALHGNLLFQGTVRVPLVLTGPAVVPAVRSDAVSVRQVYDTVLAWAGHATPRTLLVPHGEPVLAEALRPFLQYGWQPQVMAVHNGIKVMRDSAVSVFDLAADPNEANDVAGGHDIDSALRRALRGYPIAPARDQPTEGAPLSDEAQARLASLGYAGGGGRAPVRDDAPNPRAMTATFEALDRGSRLFAAERYEAAIPVLTAVLDHDPHNLMVHVRLAVAHSVGDRPRKALAHFDRARALDPASSDVRHYQAMHHLRAHEWDNAAALFESVLRDTPNRLPALAGLAQVREVQGRFDDAIALLERAAHQGVPSAADRARLGNLHMALGNTAAAIAAFEHALALDPERFAHHLELGVLYLASRRVEDARASLDAVSSDHPGYAMALFKRAQVSVLLNEPDRANRIRQAHNQGDATTRPMIEREALFASVDWQ